MAKNKLSAAEQLLNKLKEDKLVPQKATLADVEGVFSEKLLALIENLENRLELAYDELGAYQEAYIP